MDSFAGQKLDRRLNWTEEYIAALSRGQQVIKFL